MTETEAQTFLAKCKRRLLWREDISDKEAIKKLKRGTWIALIAFFLRFDLSISRISKATDKVVIYTNVGLALFCLVLIGIMVWTLIRVGQAQRVLNKSQIINQKS